MNNRITELEISNFKSIKNIKIDCKRINVFIGKPNVGKSNVLEALSLFCDSHNSKSGKFLDEYIRYEKISDIFYDQDRNNTVEIKTDIGYCLLKYNNYNDNSFEILTADDYNFFDYFKERLGTQKAHEEITEHFRNIKIKSGIQSTYTTLYDNSSPRNNYSVAKFNSPIKKYHFKPLPKHTNHFSTFLLPPYGENLFTVLEANPKLWDECAEYFNQYGLDLLVDAGNEKIEVQKKVGRRVTKIPYSLAADTLQRFIFHLAAIRSNSDSILLFEEPENHSYPPYISSLAEEIIESADNQFFIATHSPYLLGPFIEKCPPEDLAIFIADYKNYETIIRPLTEEEITNIQETGIDLFFNMSAFQE